MPRRATAKSPDRVHALGPADVEEVRMRLATVQQDGLPDRARKLQLGH
jgi:hypothetical protein